jgi:Fe-S-cluster containining protein
MANEDSSGANHDPTNVRQDPTAPGQESTIHNSVSNIFKTCETITIPQQLLDVKDARYIRLETTNDKRKKPIDRKWSTERNYTAESAVMKGWLLGGNDYGIATGFGGLHCFDADDTTTLKQLGVLDELPRTFTVKTGNGLHKWYRIEGMTKQIKLYHDDIHLGEVQSRGQYAVGPGSMHKSGVRYTVIDESPIATITQNELLSILTNHNITFKQHKPQQEEHKEFDRAAARSNYDVDILKLCRPEHATKEGDEWIGEHPLHGATNSKDRGTSRNFSVNPSKGYWHCFAHDDGGSWVRWLAIELGIRRCGDGRTGKLDKDEYAQVMDEAERRGLITQQNSRKQAEMTASNRTVIDELTTELPEEKLEVIIASPRTGKTYNAVKMMKKEGEGSYFAPNHEIVRHALHDAIKLGATPCIHTEGKTQPGMCRRPEEDRLMCRTCQMFPESQRDQEELGETWATLKKKARALMKEKKILTKETIPIDMCPYFTLLFAEEFANYKFSVINNINSTGIGEARYRKLVVIDEDTCMNFFYPQTIEIATVTMGHGKAHITTPLDSFDVANRITELSRQNRSKLKKYANKMKEIQVSLAALDGEKVTVKEVEERIRKIMETWEPTRAKLDNEDYGSNDEVKFGDIAKCMMFPYQDIPVTTVTRGFRSKIYLMADETHATMNMEWLEHAEKVVIIGAARAEIFATEFGGEVREVEKFRFENNFTVISVGEKPGEDGRGKKGRMKKKLIEVAKLLSGGSDNERMIPIMVLAGSEEEQDSISNSISNGTFKCTTEGETALKRVHVSGLAAVYYANSRISRGLDVDQYNVLVAVGTDFAQPFYSAVNKEIKDKITIDEITNSVLRISPTRKQGADKAKVIVIAEDDEWKIKYLKGRIVRTTASAKGIAKTIRAMGIGGESTMAGTELKITKHGASMDGAYVKIHSKLATVDSEVDDAEVEMRTKQILDLLKSKREMWMDMKEIKDKIHMRLSVASKAVEEISYKKLASTIVTNGTIKLRHKKNAEK